MLPVQKIRYGRKRSHPLARRRAWSAVDTVRSRELKPEWDASNHDLNKFKLSPEEVFKRKLATISPHNTLARFELQRKLHKSGVDMQVSQATDGSFYASMIVKPHSDELEMESDRFEEDRVHQQSQLDISSVIHEDHTLNRSIAASVVDAVRTLRSSKKHSVLDVTMERYQPTSLVESEENSTEYDPSKYERQSMNASFQTPARYQSPARKHSILQRYTSAVPPAMPAPAPQVAIPATTAHSVVIAAAKKDESVVMEATTVAGVNTSHLSTPVKRITREVRVPNRIAHALLGQSTAHSTPRTPAPEALDVSEITKVQSFATGITAALASSDNLPRYEQAMPSSVHKSTTVAFGRGVSLSTPEKRRTPAATVAPPTVPIAAHKEAHVSANTPASGIDDGGSSPQMAAKATPTSLPLTLPDFGDLEARIDQLAARLSASVHATSEQVTPPVLHHREESVMNRSVQQLQQQPLTPAITLFQSVNTNEPTWHAEPEQQTPALRANSGGHSNDDALARVRKYLDEFRRAKAVVPTTTINSPPIRLSATVFDQHAQELPLPSTSSMQASAMINEPTIYAYVPKSSAGADVQVTPQPRISYSFVTPPPSPPRDSVGHIIHNVNAVSQSDENLQPKHRAHSKLRWFTAVEQPTQQTPHAPPQHLGDSAVTPRRLDTVFGAAAPLSNTTNIACPAAGMVIPAPRPWVAITPVKH